MDVKKINKSKSFSIDFGHLQRPRSLNDVVYENIKAGIMTGKLVVGEIYSELELARSFGVSRTPVREALLKLSAENLIVFHYRKGMSVTYFSKKDIEDLFDLRQMIEEVAIDKIVGSLSEDQIQTAKNILMEQENCKKHNYDGKLFLEIDRRFHLFLIETSGNRFMVQTYKNIRDYLTITGTRALMKQGRADEVIGEHKAIIDAFLQRNVKKAREALNKHLMNSKLTALENHIE